MGSSEDRRRAGEVLMGGEGPEGDPCTEFCDNCGRRCRVIGLHDWCRHPGDCEPLERAEMEAITRLENLKASIEAWVPSLGVIDEDGDEVFAVDYIEETIDRIVERVP